MEARQHRDFSHDIALQNKFPEMWARCPSLAPLGPLFCALFNRGGNMAGLVDYQGRAGIISIVRWNLRLVIFGLDGRNRAIVIAGSLARLIAAIRITSVRRSLADVSPSTNTEVSSHGRCVRCAAIRITQLRFIHATFVPRGFAEWPARVDRVR